MFRYPQSEEYHAVFSALLLKHPFLRDSSSSGYVSFCNFFVIDYARDFTRKESKDAFVLEVSKMNLKLGFQQVYYWRSSDSSPM